MEQHCLSIVSSSSAGADGASSMTSEAEMVQGRSKVFQHTDGERDDEDVDKELNSSLWSNLSEDLLLSILARLPLESLARHQAVCRDWQALWQNCPFLHLRDKVSSHNSWFIFQQNQRSLTSPLSVDCYNTHTNKWHEFRFDHLPQVQRVCATAGSLLLCVGKIRVGRLPTAQRDVIPGRIEPPSYKFLDMIVCNPLKPNSWERIPERLGSFIPHIGIVSDPHTGNYQVIFASVDKTEVYNSLTKSWRLFDNILSPIHEICSSLIEYKGKLLFLGVGTNGQGKVFVYNLDDNKCSSFDNLYSQDPFPRFGYLENCGGHLVMMRVTVSPTELLRSRELQHRRTIRFERNFQLRVCEYVHTKDDLSDGMWQELTSIPLLDLENSMSVESKEGALFLAVASARPQNDLLCFTIGMRKGKLDWTNCVKGRAVFLYSFSQNTWCFVGERPAAERTHGAVICMRSLHFQPSLQATLIP